MVIRSYSSADTSLTGRNKESRKLANNTYLHRVGASICVKLHSTDIITYYQNGDIKLNTGGWQTVTTKARMNDYIPRDVRIYSTKGIWYVAHVSYESGYRDESAYADGFTIHPDGSFSGIGTDPQEKLKLKRKLVKFADEYMNEFAMGHIPAPSAGDCFMCQFDLGKDASHVLSHLEEKYYVPSLLNRATERFQVSRCALDLMRRVWTGESSYPDGIRKAFGDSFDDIGVKQLQKSLRRYLVDSVGIQA